MSTKPLKKQYCKTTFPIHQLKKIIYKRCLINISLKWINAWAFMDFGHLPGHLTWAFAPTYKCLGILHNYMEVKRKLQSILNRRLHLVGKAPLSNLFSSVEKRIWSLILGRHHLTTFMLVLRTCSKAPTQSFYNWTRPVPYTPRWHMDTYGISWHILH